MTNSQNTSVLPLHSLGKTGLQVSSLCLGCSPLGHTLETAGYPVSEEQAMATLRAVFKSPITFLDTAAAYGDGLSERRIGMVLNELGGIPEGYVVVTKADRDLQTGEFTGEQVRRSVDRSLKLLGLDRLQLVYLHDPEYSITFAEAMAPNGPVAVLQRLKEELVIEHIGIASGPIDLMTKFVETRVFDVALTHNRYTLLNTDADPFWDLCRKYGVGTVNAAPYGSGILAKGPAVFPRYRYAEASEEYIEKATRIEAACKRYDIPLAAAALQFSLREPRIDATVVGMTHPERIDETVKFALLQIPDELWNEIEEIL
jgi:D-threo-aldose 1-dehydrogenase